MMMKSVQPAFAQPPWSVRRKLSDRSMTTSQMNITQAKKMNIDHMTSRNVNSPTTISLASLIVSRREPRRSPG